MTQQPLTQEPPRPSAPPSLTTSLHRGLLPLCVVVFLEFLAIGLPLSVLPVHLHGTLGFASFIVGLVVGAQSAATLVTRHAAGTHSDRGGPRRAAVLGLSVSALAGATSLLSLAAPDATTSLVLLLAGRGLLGVGESLVITSALAWGIALTGRARSGFVMSWIGIAMYGALAFGAPIGAMLDDGVGLGGVWMVAALAPLTGIAIALVVPAVRPLAGAGLPFRRVARMIWLPGLGLALGAVGFGAIAAFSTLLFQERGWADPALTMSAFGIAYVVARLLFGGLPDRFGGARIALMSATIAAIGQLGMWSAPSPEITIAAAALTGFGFSLAFPAFGVEAIRDVPPERRGVALGAYVMFFDATLGFGVPALGAIVGVFGYGAAFATGTLTALGSLSIAAVLLVRSATARRGHRERSLA